MFEIYLLFLLLPLRYFIPVESVILFHRDKLLQFLFLDASSHRYKSVCPSAKTNENNERNNERKNERKTSAGLNPVRILSLSHQKQLILLGSMTSLQRIKRIMEAAAKEDLELFGR